MTDIRRQAYLLDAIHDERYRMNNADSESCEYTKHKYAYERLLYAAMYMYGSDFMITCSYYAENVFGLNVEAAERWLKERNTK